MAVIRKLAKLFFSRENTKYKLEIEYQEDQND